MAVITVTKRIKTESGNPVREVSRINEVSTISTRGLVVDGVYHAESMLRRGTKLDARKDPRLLQGPEGYNSAKPVTDQPLLRLDTRLPDPGGWSTSEESSTLPSSP